MDTFDGSKIQLFPHVLENTEKDLERASLLLGCLVRRCDNMSGDIYCKDEFTQKEANVMPLI